MSPDTSDIEPENPNLETDQEPSSALDRVGPQNLSPSHPLNTSTDRAEHQITTDGSYSELYRGPLPHPAHLARFEQIEPGCAKRILGWTEDEAYHRRDMEKVESERQYELEKMRIDRESQIQLQAIQSQSEAVRADSNVRVQIGCGAHGIAGVAIIAGVFLAMNGQSQSANVVFGVLAFIYGGGLIVTLLNRQTSKASKTKQKIEEE